MDLCQLLNVVKSENFLNCWSSSSIYVWDPRLLFIFDTSHLSWTLASNSYTAFSHSYCSHIMTDNAGRKKPRPVSLFLSVLPIIKFTDFHGEEEESCYSLGCLVRKRQSQHFCLFFVSKIRERETCI